MILVHDTFICKPGNASKLAKMFKEAMAGNEDVVHVMTDMTGPFNKVVLVSKYENLTAYEKSWEKYKQESKEMKEAMAKMAGYQEMYLTGSREIYQVMQPTKNNFDSDFNRDFGVTTGEVESHGLGVFLRDGEKVCRSYFTTGRGADSNGARPGLPPRFYEGWNQLYWKPLKRRIENRKKA